MSSSDIATHTFYNTLGADRAVGGGHIVAGDPIKLMGWVLSNFNAVTVRTVDIEDSSGNRLWRVRVPAGGMVLWNFPVLLSDGMVFKSVHASMTAQAFFTGDSSPAIVSRGLLHAQLDAERTIESGDPIILHGVMFSNVNATTNVTDTRIQRADTDANIMRLAIEANEAGPTWEGNYVADHGIKFTAAVGTSDAYVTAVYDRT